MYTQQDKKEISQRLTRYWTITLVIFAGFMALYVTAMIQRIQMLAMVSGAAMFVEVCFAWLMYLWPCHCYSKFLRDMDKGLTREMKGRLVEVSEKVELHDGVRVHPVRIFLLEEQDERIVYLNTGKAEGFPQTGTVLKLHCYGRHIKDFTPEV